MKKTDLVHQGELRTEYDFASMKGGVRGKYYAAPAPTAFEPRRYARLLPRLRAAAIDGLVYVASPAVVVLIASAIGSSSFGARTLATTWLAFLLLYEPLLVSLRGATIGHAHANIRVADARTGANPSFPRSFVRFVVKTLLGILAFAFVATTRRYQAAHDLVAGTTVEIRDLSKVRPGG